jgi:uncharacterized protein (TIGR02996 family)
MNHEQAFLQAIRETPDDDAPRLIYADWLEEQGGAARAARANFIRIQCRLAELPEDDPVRDRLEDDAADLLTEHENEWTQPLHDIAEDWRFSRGFIEHIRIRGENLLRHAEKLFDFAPLRSLQLLISRDDVPHLAACSQLHWVSSLDFSRCPLNDRALQQLLTSPHLKRLSALNLDGNDINTPGLRALIRSPLFARLQRLDLSRNRAIGDTAVRLLAHEAPADNLEVLRLCQTNLSMGGLDDLFDSSCLPRLRHLHASGVRRILFMRASIGGPSRNVRLLTQLRSLDLSDNQGVAADLGSILGLASYGPVDLHALYIRNTGAESRDVEHLAQSSALANLTVLDLARNNLGASGAQALAQPPYLTSLTHLNVSHNNIRDTGAKAIAEAPRLRHLRVLNLGGNGIGGPGLKALAGSTNLDHLRTLNLSGNFIGADSVRALVESAHLRKVTSLDLSDASLEEDSARVLASAANLTRLTTLLLKKNLLGDGGAKALAQSPHLSRLSWLDLNDNRIGKAGAEALAAASWRLMRTLDLRGNVFTDTQEALLRKRFGNAVQL